MNRFAHHIPKPDSISRSEARCQLAMLLANARDEKLAGFTAAGLAGMFKVPAAEIEERLRAERARRG